MADKALEIATKHIQRMNPSHWDGQGEPPEDFDTMICTYSIDDDNELDISFEKDPEMGGWCHLCELRDKSTEELIDIMSGYTVGSQEAIADTIEELCGGLLK